jgi:WD40 repeat protein
MANVKVHIDVQGFVPALPDAHFVGFPILSTPSTTTESLSPRQPPETATFPSQFAAVEIFLHRLLAVSSIPVDLLIPPYSRPLPPLPATSHPSRLGKIALHPELPIVAFAQAHAGGTIFLFDLRTNAFLKYKLLLPASDQLNALVFSKYNLLAAGTSSGRVIIYDLNLSVAASTSTKPLNRSAIPSFASLIPPQLPSFELLGEITDLNFDPKSGRYLAIATTRSGTWIYDTVYSSSLRLSKYPSSAVAFSPTENVLAVARERTGEIELYTLIRAGTLTFSLPTVSKSGFKATVTRMQWAEDGKSLLYCNDKQEGIRILYVQCQPVIPPRTPHLLKYANVHV